MGTFLKENGYCVLTGAADAKAVEQADALLWDFLESHPASQAKHEDPTTWDDAWLPNTSNGILGIHGFGQSAFCWHARLLPKVRQAFEMVWSCKDVIASFDGGNMFRPWRSKPERRTAGGWWHVFPERLPSEPRGPAMCAGSCDIHRCDAGDWGLVCD